MIQVIKNKEGTNMKEFVCDKKADMADIDLRVCGMGTTCFVIEEDTIYILNSKKEWTVATKENVTSLNGMTGAVTLSTATTSANGLMSSQDKSRLDDLYADYSSALTALGV